MNITKKQFTVYMLCAYLSAWVIQIIAGIFANQGNTAVYQLLLMLVMLMPIFSVLTASKSLKGLGWTPHLKGKLKYLFIALWIPAVFGTIGAVLYFLLFPDAFDLTGDMLKAQVGETVLQQLEAQDLTVPMYLAVSAVQAVTFAPFLNMIPAVGEEAGWRGFMYPYLKEKFGTNKGRIFGGILWGAWHWPIMILAGYEYGKNYFGAPFIGMLFFCVFATTVGIFFDMLYEKTNCIWIPALAHGAVNAFGSIPVYLMKSDYADQLIFGASYIGIISGIPFLILAVIICLKAKKVNPS